MYLEHGRTYYVGSEQRAQRGWFLLLLQLRDKPCNAENVYACVRRVALSQFGHFMMGRANLNGSWKTVSGAYGSDGLPMDVDALPADAVQLPAELYHAWNEGGGHNGAGKEAWLIRDWARAQFKAQLTKKRRTR